MRRPAGGRLGECSVPGVPRKRRLRLFAVKASDSVPVLIPELRRARDWNGKGEVVKGEWDKGMESALWVVQGTPGRGGKLAAASRC